MTTFQEQFGNGSKPIGLDQLNMKGESRHCVGHHKPSHDWYGWINEVGFKVPANKLSFCSGCFRNYLPKDRCYLITEEEYPNYVGYHKSASLVCDSPNTNKKLEC